MKNNFYQLLQNRRSIRQYTQQPIDEEVLKKIAHAVLMAPSSKRKMPWEFVIVQNKELLKKLSECRPYGATLIANASACFVVTADTEKTDVWIEDAAIAAIIIQLQAEDIGLGSCWVQVRNRTTYDGELSSEYIKQLLNIPSNMEVLCMIALGYKNEQRTPFAEDKLALQKIHFESFNGKTDN